LPFKEYGKTCSLRNKFQKRKRKVSHYKFGKTAEEKEHEVIHFAIKKNIGKESQKYL
jgi:hypothetical protein